MEIKLDIKEFKTLLNLGAGKYTSPNGGIRAILDFVPNKIAYDIFSPYLETWKEDPSWILMMGDIRDLSCFFLEKSFDMVTALDVIEHLSVEEGNEMLSEIDRLCKKMAVIFTPDGYIDTYEYQAELIDDNPFQIHKSGWFKEDFEKRGYEVHVLKNYHPFGEIRFNAILAIKYFKENE